MTESNNCVSPRSRAEYVAHVRNSVAERRALFRCFQGIAESSPRPGGSFFEEGLQRRDGFLEGFIECFDGGTVFAGFCGDGGDVIIDCLREDFDGL